MNDFEKNLISADTIPQVAGTLWYVTKVFGDELGNELNLHYLRQNDRGWFGKLRSKRRATGDFNYKTPADFRFQISESEAVDSPLRESIPGFTEEWLQEAVGIRKNLNKYHHGDFEANIDTLEMFLTPISVLAHLSGLKVLEMVSGQLERINKIRQGWVSQSITSLPEPPEEVRDFIDAAERKRQRIFARPPVGSRWYGEEGKREIILDLKLRDAIDAHNGRSIAQEIGPGGKEKIRDWIRHFPQGGLLKVSDDGAVMGYIKGLAYLVGWFGDEPDVDPDEIRGYYLPVDFTFTGDDVINNQTGELLSEVAQEDITELISVLESKTDPNTLLNVTNYGDLVVDDGTDEKPTKLTNIHGGIWFQDDKN